MGHAHALHDALRRELRLFRLMLRMRQFRWFLVATLCGLGYVGILGCLAIQDGLTPPRETLGPIHLLRANGEEYAFDGENHFARNGNQWVPYTWPGFDQEKYDRAIEAFVKSPAYKVSLDAEH